MFYVHWYLILQRILWACTIGHANSVTSTFPPANYENVKDSDPLWYANLFKFSETEGKKRERRNSGEKKKTEKGVWMWMIKNIVVLCVPVYSLSLLILSPLVLH